VTDPSIVHATERKISVLGIYEASEVNALVEDYLAKKGNNALERRTKPAVDRHDIR
jgi:type I restriction enzyme R subunit